MQIKTTEGKYIALSGHVYGARLVQVGRRLTYVIWGLTQAQEQVTRLGKSRIYFKSKDGYKFVKTGRTTVAKV